MKCIGAQFLRQNALHGVNHMHGLQYKKGLHITFWPGLN